MPASSAAQLAPAGAPAFFIAENPALDFLNSIASPVDVPVEWLGDGAALTAWLRQSQLVSESVLNDMAERALPGELDAIAGQARALREWFRSFVLKHKGRVLPPAALSELDPVNRILARDARHAELVLRNDEDQSGTPFQLVDRRIWNSPEALLVPIAETMARLVAEQDFARVRGCEGHVCTLLFVDNTRRSARRWCSMAVCGNRAKVAAFRRRAQS